MNKTNLLNRVEINPKIMLGKPIIKGTRIPLYVILNLLAEEHTPQQICEDYPDLTHTDIKAAIQFASQLTVFEETPLPTKGLVHV